MDVFFAKKSSRRPDFESLLQTSQDTWNFCINVFFGTAFRYPLTAGARNAANQCMTVVSTDNVIITR